MPPIITSEDYLNQDAYIAASHKQFGDLHERMKWLIGCKEELKEYIDTLTDKKLQILFQALSVAVMDLETEVAYTKPAKPPYGKRAQKINDPRAHVQYQHKKNS